MKDDSRLGDAEEDGFYEKVALLVDSIDSLNKLDKTHFFGGTFDAAFRLIPEAQKGSLWELTGELYVPVYAKGYDMGVLGRLAFGKEIAFLDFECRDNAAINAYESWIQGRDEVKFTPEAIETFKALGTYSGFVSLHAPIQVAGRNIGIICLENFEGRGFSRVSKEILKFYARLISSYYTRWMEGEERSRLLAGKLDSLRHLAAGVAHELNTPLGAVQSAVASLRDGFARRLPSLLGVGGHTNSPEEVLLESLLARAPDLEPAASAPRAYVKSVSRRLDEAGLPRAAELAELLHYVGHEPDSAELEAFATHGWKPSFIDLLLELRDLMLMLDVAGTATHRMGKIIKLLAFYTRVERPKALVAVDAAESLDRTLRLMEGDIPPGIVVERDFRPSRPAAGEAERLGQVWRSLVGNAIQAMGPSGRLALMVREDGDSILVDITDDGSGIAAGDKPYIFDPFFTTREPGKGLGLGLAVAKTMVESCMGSISFESSAGGTTFTVRLPVWRDGLYGEASEGYPSTDSE